MPKITPQHWINEDAVDAGPELWTLRSASLTQDQHLATTDAVTSCAENAPRLCLLTTLRPSVTTRLLNQAPGRLNSVQKQRNILDFNQRVERQKLML